MLILSTKIKENKVRLEGCQLSLVEYVEERSLVIRENFKSCHLSLGGKASWYDIEWLHGCMEAGWEITNYKQKKRPFLQDTRELFVKVDNSGKTGGLPAHKHRTLNIKQYIYQILMVK
jgi:hypothetical protein